MANLKRKSMTSEEKAESLIRKFTREMAYNCQPSVIYMIAHRCAIICVEEIIHEYSVKFPPKSNEQLYVDSRTNYWQQVLNHLKQKQ